MKDLSSERAEEAFKKVKKNIGKRKKKNTITGLIAIVLGVSTVVCGYSYYQYKTNNDIADKVVQEEIKEKKPSTFERGKTIEGKKEDYQEIETITVHIESDLNETIRDMLNQEDTEILVITELNTKTYEYGGKCYRLKGNVDKSTFKYIDVPNFEVLNCDFVKEKYKELCNLLLKGTLEEDKDLVEANGKIIYTVEPIVIMVRNKEGKGYRLKPPKNIEEILSYVYELEKAAR